MTTEREMLEYAAKACGQPFDAEASIQKKGVNVWWGLWVNGTSEYDQGHYWNPKDNSADCATMCAKLDINTLFAQTNPIVSCWKEGVGDTTTTHYNENHDGTDAGKEAAWRYAATMVAAKIGGMR